MTQILIQVEDATLLSSIKKVLKSLQGVSIKEIKEPNPKKKIMSGIEKSMDDIKNGRVREIKDTKAYFKKLGVNV
jgi:hypothetical protein